MATVTLANKPYTLDFGTKALRTYEAETGSSLMELEDNVSISVIVALLRAGLVKYHDLSMDEVDDLLDAHLALGGTIDDVTVPLLDAIGESGWFRNPTQATPSCGVQHSKPE